MLLEFCCANNVTIMSDLDGYITVQEAAKVLGVNIYRVHQIIRDGRLPSIKVGTIRLIRNDDLALVAHRKVGRPKKEARQAAKPSESGVTPSPNTKTPATRAAAPKKAITETKSTKKTK